MKRAVTNVSFLLFIFLMSTAAVQAQDLIEVISSFSTGNLDRRDCGDGNTVTGGGSLCVTDLEGGSCGPCMGGPFTGDNSSEYRITGIDVSDYCSILVEVDISGSASGDGFENASNFCGEDIVSVSISSGGESGNSGNYSTNSSSINTTLDADIGNSGNTLSIRIQLGTQAKDETICIDEVRVYGFGSGIDINALDGDPFCVGQTAQLALSGENPSQETYSWVGPNGFTSTSPQPNIPNVDFSDQGLYICLVENSSGCFTEVEFELFVVEAGPGNVSLNSNPDNACEGDGITLKANTSNPDNGNFIYEWFFNGNPISGQNDDDYSISNLDASDNGIYEVLVIDPTAPNACMEDDDDYALLTLDGPGNVTAGLLDNYCVGDGQDVIMQANTSNNGDYQYIWIDENGDEIASGLNMNQLNIGQVDQELITLYFVQVFNPDTGCGLDNDLIDIDVIILDGPGQLVGNESYTVCGGGDLTLQADPTNTGDYEVNWIYPDNTDDTFVAPTGTITLNNVTDFGNDGIADEYSVILIDQNTGCFATKIISVLIGDEVPPPTVTTTGGSCNEVAELTGTLGTDLTLVWYDDVAAADNAFIATGSPATDVNTSQVINTAGTYYAAAYSATFDCYSARIEIELGTGNTLNTSITADQSICEGETINLTATGGTDYQWSNNATGASINVSPINTSTFTVTISDGMGCEATESVTVTVAPRPNITVAQAAACPEGTFTEYGLTISTAAGSSLSSNPSADITDLGGGDFALANLPVGTDVEITVTSAAGCVNIQTISSAACGCPTIAAPIILNETTACEGTPFSPLSVQAPSDPDTEEIRWYTLPTGGTVIATGAVLGITTSGTYYAEIYNLTNDCQSERTALTLTINPLPEANISGDLNVCPDETTTLTASGGTSYAWSNSLSGASVDVPNGTYTVTVSDANGCTDTENVSVGLNSLPTLTTAPNIDCAADRMTYSVQVSTQTGNTLGIDRDTGTISGGDGNFTITGIPAGQNITISLTNAANCSIEETITAPACPCPTLAAPQPGNTVEVCQGEALPALTVTASLDADSDIRWFDSFTGGTQLATGTSLNATTSGTYFAEVYNSLSDCASGRVAVELIIHPEAMATIVGPDQVCPMEEVNLTAVLNTGTITALSWSTGTTFDASIVTGAGIYEVTITDENNCEAIASKTITEFPVAPLTISGALEICAGETTELIASGGMSYVWNNSINDDRITVAAGTFSVTATDSNGCESIESVTITQNPLPTITETLTAACSEDLESYSFSISTESDATLSSTAGTVSGSNGLFTISDVPKDVTTTITVENSAGCTTSQSFSSPGCECPTLAAPQTANNNFAICADEDFPTLIISNAGVNADSEIRWYSTATGGVSIATGFNFMPNAAGMYYAEIFNTVNNCPSPRTEISVVVNALPAVSITGADEVCPNVSTEIIANAQGTGLSYQWSSNAANATTPNTDVGVGIFTVTVTDANNCINTATKFITEFSVTQATISGNLSICPGEQTTLTASEGESYNWNTFEQSTQITVDAGDYLVTVTDTNGCNSTASVEVIEEAAPSITETSAAACAEDLESYSFSISTESDATLSSTAGTVSGSNGLFTISDVPKDVTTTITVENSAGCTTSQSFSSPGCECPTLAAPQTANNNFAICADEDFPTLTISNAGVNADSEIRWYSTATGGVSIASGFNFMPNAAGMYYAEIFHTVNNCPSPRTEISVVVNELPTVSITGADEVCPNVSTEIIANAEGTGLSYQWSSNAANATTPNTDVGAGIFTVTVTDINNCINTATKFITEFSVTQATISGELSICPGEQTTLAASEGERYNWNTFEQNAQITVDAGDYVVTVTDTNGCNSTVAVEVIEEAAPSIQLVDGIVDCTEDLERYFFSILTENDATLSSTAGVVSGSNGLFTVSDIPKDELAIVTVQNAAGCTASQSFSSPNCECPTLAAPQAANNNLSICEEENFPTLAVSNAGVNTDSEIRWYSTATGGTAIATGFNFVPNAAGTYYAEIFNAVNNCQSPRTEISVVVLQNPVVGIIGASIICPNTVTPITATNAATYTWSDNANNATTQSIEVGAGTYEVSITGANGCTEVATKTINEFPAATAAISGQLELCPGETTELTATGGEQYIWSNFETGERVTVPAGTFMVTMTDSNGCEDTETVTVLEHPAPTINIVDEMLICSDDLETYGFDIITEAGNQLTTSLGIITGNTGTFRISDITKDMSVTITITNPLTGCVSEEVINAPDCPCPTLAAPQNSSAISFAICSGATRPAFTIADVDIDDDSEVRWYSTATGGMPIAAGFDFTPEQAGMYFAEIFNTINECTSPRTAFELVINDLPTATIAGEENLCPNTSTTLVASTATNYLWSTGETTQNIEVGAGDYDLTITDENGCENSAVISIESFTVNEAFISGDNIICPNESTTLTASPGTNFEWSTDETSNTIEVRAGTYLLVVTDENNCESRASFEVEETENPSFAFVQNLNCTSDLLSYNFTIQTDIENLVTTNLGLVQDLGAGNWQVTAIPAEQDVEMVIENTEGCKTVESINAIDCSCPTLANPTVSEDVTICVGDAFPTFEATSPDLNEMREIRWYDVETGGTVLATGIAFVPSAAGTYFAELIEAESACVSTRVAVTLTINELPSISITGETEVCPDQNSQLTANPAETYLWSTGETSPTIDAEAGIYTLTISDTNGCENTTSIELTTYTTTPASISGELLICEDGSTLLSANEGVNYLWSNGETSQSIEVGTGNYALTVTDENGCENVTMVDVTERAALTLTIVDNLLECSDDRAFYQFNLLTDAGNTVTATAGTVVQISDELFSVRDIPIASSVALSVINALTGCSSQQLITPPDCSCAELAPPMSNGDIEICTGTPLPSLSVSLSDENLTVNWYASLTGDDLLAENTLSFTPTSPGTYFAETIDPISGCLSEDRIPVSLIALDLPIINLSEDRLVCPEQTLTLTASTSDPSASFIWNTSATSASIEVGAGTYSVRVIDSNNCESRANATIEELPAPTASIIGDENYCAGESATLTASGGDNILWNTGETTPTISVESGTYSVVVTDENGCEDTSEFSVSELASPTINVATQATCSTDNETYSIEISTEDGNTLSASEGEISGANGNFRIENITKDTPIEVRVVNPDGCEYTQTFPAADCSCPSLATPVISGTTAICAGDELPTFTAASPDLNEDREIRWYDLDMDGTALATGPTFSPNAAGTYFAELIEPASGCATARVAVTFTINELPTASITGDASYCAGESASLTASGSGGILWNTGETDLSIDVQAGTYNIVVTNASGCTNTAEFTVSENALPSINLANQASCSNDGETYSIEINTEAGNTLASSIGTASGGANGIFTIENIAKDTPVEITVLSPNGCERIQTFSAPNCECPTFALPVLSGDAAICVGDELPTFTASSPDLNENREIHWYDVDVDGTALAIGTAFTPEEAGTYYAALIDSSSGCETARVAVTLSIHALPEVTITGSMNICEDESTSLNASGAATYIWSTGERSASLEVSQTALYSVVGTDVNGCSNTADFVVNVLAKPDLSIDAPAALCEDAIATVTANGGNRYTWSTGETGASVLLSAGTYSLSASNDAGCSDELEFTIVQSTASEPTLITRTSCDENEAGEETILLQNAAGCDSLVIITTTLLNAEDCNLQFSFTSNDPACAGEASGSVTITMDNGTAPFSYTWQSLDNRTGEGNSEDTNFVITGLSSGEYIFLITDANGQQNTQTIVLNEVAALVIDLASSNFDGFGVTCPGDTNGRIEANVSGGTAPYNYTWNTNDENALLLNLSAGEYSLIVTDANECVSTATATISEPPAIEIVVDTDAAACEESSNGILNIRAIQHVDLPVEYSFNGTNFRPIDRFPFQIDDLAFGDYTLYIQDMRDCIAETPVRVEAAETAFAEIVVSANELQAGEMVQLELISNLVPSKITWTTSTGDSLSCNNCLNPTARPRIGTTYRVEITDENGCTASAQALVFVESKPIVFANAFSPNNDGANDIFYIQGGDELVAVNYLHIFDRWGNLVFSINEPFPANDIRFGWDGYVNNEPAGMAVYTFVVEVVFDDERTEVIGGDLSLNR